MLAGTMRELIRRHMVEDMLIHSDTHTQTCTCINIDVNRKSDKSALVALHVISQQEPDAGLTLHPMTLT